MRLTLLLPAVLLAATPALAADRADSPSRMSAAPRVGNMDTAQFLAIQQQEAQWWRDASIAYWQSLNHLPLPPGTAPPRQSLDYYKSLDFPEAPAD